MAHLIKLVQLEGALDEFCELLRIDGSNASNFQVVLLKHVLFQRYSEY